MEGISEAEALPLDLLGSVAGTEYSPVIVLGPWNDMSKGVSGSVNV